MTYCIGVMLDEGMIFASDSRTNAGMDNIAKFCKMTVFERRGDRVIVLLSSGNLAGTQAVIGVLNQRCAAGDAAANLWSARTMFDVAMLVADAMRDIERRDGEYLQENEIGFNASFIVGGQIGGEPLRLFRIYAEGNFIEAGVDTPYFQTGETKYGKPIIDRVITRVTPLADATKCVLVSFDSTMRSNLSVGMPIDLICYERDSLEVRMRRRFDDGDAYFTALSHEWSEGTRQVFRQLPELRLVTRRRQTARSMMQIRVGFEMIYDCPQPTPMIFNLNVHFTRVSDLVGRDDLMFDPPVPMAAYRDSFGNWCTRIVAPQGTHAHFRRCDRQRHGAPDAVVPGRAAASRARTCPRRRCCSCSAAGIARPTGCPRRRGSSSGRRRRDGAACRRSATTSTATSRSATSTRA